MESGWYDPNDPVQLKEFDDQLWQRLDQVRAYYDADLGPLQGQWDLFAVDHGRLWTLIGDHDPDFLLLQAGMVRLRIVEIGQGATVEFRFQGEDGERVAEVDGLELIGGRPDA